MNAERFEGHVQLLILITVAGMAGAGSFTHVHDWTMSVVPPHTGSWLGWVNAVITELVPAAAGIEIRRRKRQHRPVTYPMTILATDVIISIGVQLSDARHNLGGSLAFALPALAFPRPHQARPVPGPSSTCGGNSMCSACIRNRCPEATASPEPDGECPCDCHLFHPFDQDPGWRIFTECTCPDCLVRTGQWKQHNPD